MDKMFLVWLGIFMAVALAGDSNPETRKVFRWITLFIVGGLMIAFYS